MPYREVPWQVAGTAYPELVQDLLDLGLYAGCCVALDGVDDTLPVPLLVSRDATMVVEVSEFQRTPALRARTVLDNGFLVETKLRWENLPPFPGRLAKVRKLVDVEAEMTRHAAEGRSVLIATGPPEAFIDRHREHVATLAAQQRSEPVELRSTEDALSIWNTALQHGEMVEQAGVKVVDTTQLAAFVVAVLLVVTGYVSARWWFVALTPLLVGLTWLGSPYLLVLLRTSRRIRPAFPWTDQEHAVPFEQIAA